MHFLLMLASFQARNQLPEGLQKQQRLIRCSFATFWSPGAIFVPVYALSTDVGKLGKPKLASQSSPKIELNLVDASLAMFLCPGAFLDSVHASRAGGPACMLTACRRRLWQPKPPSCRLHATACPFAGSGHSGPATYSARTLAEKAFWFHKYPPKEKKSLRCCRILY